MSKNTTVDRLVRDKNCRKGEPSGYSAQGAFWHAWKPILLSTWGGGGDNRDVPSWYSMLELRHFRSGDVHVAVRVETQSAVTGQSTYYLHVDTIIHCGNCEDVLICLRDLENATVYKTLLKDGFIETVKKELKAFGLPDADPGPDSEQKVVAA